MSDELPTKDNTKFIDWWRLLNEELEKLGQKGCGLGDARYVYEQIYTPAEGASHLVQTWERP